MSGALSFAELDEQHVELLPGRTVLSVLSLSRGGGTNGHNGSSHNGVGVVIGPTMPGQTNIAGRGIGGLGGSG